MCSSIQFKEATYYVPFFKIILKVDQIWTHPTGSIYAECTAMANEEIVGDLDIGPSKVFYLFISIF